MGQRSQTSEVGPTEQRVKMNFRLPASLKQRLADRSLRISFDEGRRVSENDLILRALEAYLADAVPAADDNVAPDRARAAKALRKAEHLAEPARTTQA
jgi:multidrug efflux pump subunit AcrA (membrane-fusion protein)